MRGQTDLEKEYIPQSQDMWNTYMTGKGQNMQDYSNIMGGYQNFANNLGGPTNFDYQTVKATNPAEQKESYGYLRGAIPGYRDFAQTGGYSPTDIQELRARGISPIRSAYGNTMMEMNRARALGGSGGAPNYIAAASKAQREMPGQMADAMTGVNAQLADAIRQGKLAGLSGMTGIGSTMGGLASADAGRMLQAGMANQNADLQAQQLSEQSLQNLRQSQLAALSGQTNLYGTTPALASTFGNQALNAYQNRINMEQQRNQLGLGLLDTQIRAYGGQSQTDPWWKQALNAAGSVIPYVGDLLKKSPTSEPRGSNENLLGTGGYTPNNMGGQSYQGFMPNMPSAPQGNYQSPNTQTSGRVTGYTDPQTGQQYDPGGDSPYYTNPYQNDPYNTYNDPYMNSSNFWGYGPATTGNQFQGWMDPYSSNYWDNYNFAPEFSGNNGGMGGEPWWGSGDYYGGG
jgi:hypothetical protein